MLAFLNGNKLNLKSEKVIAGMSNISIADTAEIGETFYSGNSNTTDLPNTLDKSASFKVLTFETFYSNVDFMYQILMWDGNQGCIFYRSTYAGRQGLKKATWHNVAFQ